MPVRLDFEQLLAVIAALPARPADRSGFLAIDGQGGAGNQRSRSASPPRCPTRVSAMRTEVNVPWDLTVWVRTPRDVRLARGVERDGETMRAHWTDVWMPHEDTYVAEQNPEFRADVVIDGL